MQVSVEEQNPVSKLVQVTVDDGTVEQDVKKRLRQIGKRAKISGFRPGKAPDTVLRRRYGASARMDAIDATVKRAMGELLKRDDLKDTIHVSRPELSTGAKSGEDVSFEFVAERLPAIEPTGYLGIAIEKLKVEISDEDIDGELKQLQEQHTDIIPVEDRDAVESGDVVIVAYVGVGEGEVAEIHAEDQQIDLADPNLLEGFADGLVGAEKGKGKVIDVTLPEQFSLESIAGQAVQLEVTVGEIKRRDVPEIDDDLAAEAGDFDDLDALKEDIRKRLGEQREEAAKSDSQRRMIARIVESNPVDLPPLYVEEQAVQESRNRLMNLARQGLDVAKLGLDPRDMAKNIMDDVGRAIRESLLLREIGTKEEVKVTAMDIDAWLAAEAEKSNQPLARLKAHFASDEAKDQLRSRLLWEQVVELIWAQAKIEEVDELPPDPDAEAEEEHVHGPDCDHDHDHD